MNSTKYWIALHRVEGIGPATLKEIHSAVSKTGLSISDLFDLNETEIQGEFNFSSKIAEAFVKAGEILPSLEEEYIQVIEAGIEIIPFFSSYYPARLHEILGNSIPPFLYVSGNRDLLQKDGAAILGDINVSSRGEFISYLAAKELVTRGITVISGMASGAGLAAHRSALEYGGNTIAFLPYGILRMILPEELKLVYDNNRIAFVSIFPPFAPADKYNAFNRNRVICSLAKAVYIVEAPADGGIFEAARSAYKLKVPLYATEYSDYPENASGNKLIFSDLGGIPVKGKVVDDLTIPNMERLIADVKFK